MSTPNGSPVTKADFDAGLTQLREYIDERTRDLQTELLRAFANYNNSAAIRFRRIALEGHR